MVIDGSDYLLLHRMIGLKAIFHKVNRKAIVMKNIWATNRDPETAAASNIYNT